MTEIKTEDPEAQYSLEIVGIDFSPWSLRAKWALSHHNIPYKYTVYTPKISEPWLRYRTGKWTGNITVPVVFAQSTITGDTITLLDSYDIAKFADSIGSNSCKLFPSDNDLTAEIDMWNQKASTIMEHLRISSLIRSLDNDELREEALPGWINRCQFISNYIYRSSLNYILNKYQLDSQGIQENEASARKYLDEIREHLTKGKGEYMVGDTLTYADIAVACALQCVKPMADEYWELKPVMRRGMTCPFHNEYSDLMAWRDKLASKHCTLKQHEQR